MMRRGGREGRALPGPRGSVLSVAGAYARQRAPGTWFPDALTGGRCMPLERRSMAGDRQARTRATDILGAGPLPACLMRTITSLSTPEPAPQTYQGDRGPDGRPTQDRTRDGHEGFGIRIEANERIAAEVGEPCIVPFTARRHSNGSFDSSISSVRSGPPGVRSCPRRWLVVPALMRS